MIDELSENFTYYKYKNEMLLFCAIKLKNKFKSKITPEKRNTDSEKAEPVNMEVGFKYKHRVRR